MAIFDDAYKLVVNNEGGYVFDKDDSGGETYKGVSRRNNPKWKGWDIIDKYKKSYKGKSLSNVLNKDNELQTLVYKLYKDKYWDIFELDDVPSQKIAYQMFDTCVNCGTVAAIKCAESALGRRITGRWTLNLLHDLVSINS